MVTIEKQFEVACQLARQYEHSLIGFACSLSQWHELCREELSLGGAVISTHWLEVEFENGSKLKFIESNDENVSERYSGFQFTSLFFTDETSISRANREYLIDRMRSSKYKGLFKAYYPRGIAIWTEAEVYGS